MKEKPRYEVVIFWNHELERYGASLSNPLWRATELTRERADRLAESYRRNLARRHAPQTVIVRPLGSSRDAEGIGHGGYAAPRQGETRMQQLRRLAEKRRRYRRLTQAQGEQGPGYDQRRRRKRRRSRR